MTNAERRQMMVSFFQGGSVAEQPANINKESVSMSKVLERKDNVTLVDFLNNGGTMDEVGAMIGAKCAKVVIKGGNNKITVPSNCDVELIVEDGTNDITIVDSNVDNTIDNVIVEEDSVWAKLKRRQENRFNK